MLIDDCIKEIIEPPEYPITTGDETRQAVDEASSSVGEEILGGEAAKHVHRFTEHVQELHLEMLRAIDFPEHHRADDAVHGAEDVLVELHRVWPGTGQVFNKLVNLTSV